jgi:hypothetical protein
LADVLGTASRLLSSRDRRGELATLVPGLEAIIVRVKSLTRDDPAARALLARLQLVIDAALKNRWPAALAALDRLLSSLTEQPAHVAGAPLTLAVSPPADASAGQVAGFAAATNAPYSYKRSAAPAVHERSGSAAPVSELASVAPPLGQVQPSTGGATLGASGGVGSSGSAIALLPLLAVLISCFLSARLALHHAAWRSALLPSPLERPG